MVATNPPVPQVPRSVALWAPKGGVGTTTLAVNLCGIAPEWGVDATYADDGDVWADAATWQSPPGSGVAPAARFRCRVADLASATTPDPKLVVGAEVLLVVVSTDLLALRRARLAADRGWFDPGHARIVTVGRPGAALSPADAAAVVGVPVLAALPYDPSVVGAGDRGRLVWSAARAPYARAVRDLAERLFGRGAGSELPAGTRTLRSGRRGAAQ